MGRELRMVPPNWEHPRYTREYAPHSGRVGDYKPLHDRDYEAEAREWLENCAEWELGKHPSQKDSETAKECKHYWEYNGNPPDKDFYRPLWKPEDMTRYQVYETVSEGTPVSPPFATKEELIEYLVANGDFWDQQRGNKGWSRKAAENFVMDTGWAPSLIISDRGVESGVEGIAALKGKG